jgi:hypothetical protein
VCARVLRLVRDDLGDDYASYGAVMEKFLADADAMKLLMKASGADGPTASFQGSLWSDIDL